MREMITLTGNPAPESPIVKFSLDLCYHKPQHRLSLRNPSEETRITNFPPPPSQSPNSQQLTRKAQAQLLRPTTRTTRYHETTPANPHPSNLTPPLNPASPTVLTRSADRKLLTAGCLFRGVLSTALCVREIILCGVCLFVCLFVWGGVEYRAEAVFLGGGVEGGVGSWGWGG